MKLRDLFASRDGSLSVTKTFVTLAHTLMFVTVAWITYLTQRFDFQMWSLYLGCTILHASYDKTMATVNAYKTRAPTPGGDPLPPIERP